MKHEKISNNKLPSLSKLLLLLLLFRAAESRRHTKKSMPLENTRYIEKKAPRRKTTAKYIEEK
jgi:hypothetical protein